MIPAVYGSEATRETRFDALARSAGARIEEYGRSVQGRTLRTAFVPTTATETVPTVLVNANIHGVEWIGALSALGVLEALSNDRGKSLRSKANVVIAPCANPDGWANTETLQGKGTLKQVRCNANGVDLNRNFPLPHGAKPGFLTASGSSSPSAATYRGSEAFSEPEAKALDTLAERYHFHAAVSFHSFMGTLIPPKVLTREDARAYRQLCAAWRAGQTHFRALTLMSPFFDVFTGELEDHLHHVHHCWSLTVEVFPVWRSLAEHLFAPSIFARFNPQDPARYIDDSVGGCLSYIEAALAMPAPR